MLTADTCDLLGQTDGPLRSQRVTSKTQSAIYAADASLKNAACSRTVCVAFSCLSGGSRVAAPDLRLPQHVVAVKIEILALAFGKSAAVYVACHRDTHSF